MKVGFSIYVYFVPQVQVGIYINTSALRLLPLRGLQTVRVLRVTLRAPGVTRSNLFWDFLFNINNIYTERTKVFQHLILSHTNNTKSEYFMKGNMFKFKEILKI